MSTDQQFLTTTSILTFGGSSLAVLVISATIQRVTSLVSVGIPFIVSLVVGGAVATYAKTFNPHSPLDWLIAFVNCCHSFLTATGANELAAQRPAGGFKPQGGAPPKILYLLALTNGKRNTLNPRSAQPLGTLNSARQKLSHA